jgi:hypothetical protein
LRHVPSVGDIILFDDRLDHCVDLPAGRKWKDVGDKDYFGGVSWPVEALPQT